MTVTEISKPFSDMQHWRLHHINNILIFLTALFRCISCVSILYFEVLQQKMYINWKIQKKLCQFHKKVFALAWGSFCLFLKRIVDTKWEIEIILICLINCFCFFLCLWTSWIMTNNSSCKRIIYNFPEIKQSLKMFFILFEVFLHTIGSVFNFYLF